MLPNFLIIGAAKSGTTSLYHYLRAHPQVFMPTRKELNFFVEENNWHRGRTWYEEQFDSVRGAIAVGEASPRYAMHPVYRGVPERIFRLIPHARLIYVVRHPLERMRSHYLDRVAYGVEDEPIETALMANTIYLSASRYAWQIERYLEYFPRERLLIITSEHLRRSRGTALRRIFGFVGVDESWTAPLLDQEFHRTIERRVRRPLFQRASTANIRRAIRRVAPRSLRSLARPLASRKLSTVPARINEELSLRLTEALRDDVRRLYRYMDDGFDGWKLVNRSRTSCRPF